MRTTILSTLREARRRSKFRFDTSPRAMPYFTPAEYVNAPNGSIRCPASWQHANRQGLGIRTLNQPPGVRIGGFPC
jgi:hypothetical protein